MHCILDMSIPVRMSHCHAVDVLAVARAAQCIGWSTEASLASTC